MYVPLPVVVKLTRASVVVHDFAGHRLVDQVGEVEEPLPRGTDASVL